MHFGERAQWQVYLRTPSTASDRLAVLSVHAHFYFASISKCSFSVLLLLSVFLALFKICPCSSVTSVVCVWCHAHRCTLEMTVSTCSDTPRGMFEHLAKEAPICRSRPAGFQSSTQRPQPCLGWNVSIFLSLFAEGL